MDTLGSVAPAPTQMPHHLDAERRLLGALLFDNEAYHRLGDFLLPAHFYEPVHGRIFRAIQAKIANNELADGVSLRDHFQQDGALKEIGGAQYLFELIRAAPDPAVAPDYAKIIYDLALKRDLMRIGGEIALEASLAAGPEARALIEQAEERLFSLAEHGVRQKGFIPFKNALQATLESALAAMKNDGKISGVASGLVDLDQKLGGLHKSDLIILAGRPSMGKTALATNIAFNVAKACRRETDSLGRQKTVEGGVVAFFSLEMSAEQLSTRLLADYASLSSEAIRRGDFKNADYERLIDAVAEIEAMPLHIDETGGIMLSALATRARRLHRLVHGLDLIVIDYLQLITTGGKYSDNRVQEVTEITKGLKALAKELNVPILALSQLSRQVENREDKRPQLADLRESGSIEQDADVVMFVYREAYYLERTQPRLGTPEHDAWQQDMDRLERRAEVIIGKQRHGPIGTVELQFDAKYTRFSNLERRSF